YRSATGAARAAVRSAKIALFPRPTISAEYQHQISGGLKESATQVVGGIAFSVFDGGANRAAYKEARANQSNAEVQEQQIHKDIRAQVEEAHLNLTSARQRMYASAVSLDAANKNYMAQKERYAQGLGTTLDLLNAEVQAVTAENDNIQARYDYYLAVAQMDYALGK
ncbi:MAG TPA: TolC family protein, partial [Armatimonadota bacterium]